MELGIVRMDLASLIVVNFGIRRFIVAVRSTVSVFDTVCGLLLVIFVIPRHEFCAVAAQFRHKGVVNQVSDRCGTLP